MEEGKISPITKLIREVAKQTVLYDSQNPSYKDNQARLNAWQQVSINMEMPGTVSETKRCEVLRRDAEAKFRRNLGKFLENIKEEKFYRKSVKILGQL